MAIKRIHYKKLDKIQYYLRYVNSVLCDDELRELTTSLNISFRLLYNYLNKKV